MNRPVPSTLSVRVPFAVRKRGGRKLIVTPNGTAGRPRPRIASALVKAIARAHRWQRMLESGDYSSLTELAAAEKINLSFISRVLRLTLLAPDIVDAVLDGRQPDGVDLPTLMRPFPVDWGEQTVHFAALPSAASSLTTAAECCATSALLLDPATLGPDPLRPIQSEAGAAGRGGKKPFAYEVN